MPKTGKIEKTLKPSERKSITEFSARFGTGPTYEERVRGKKIATAILITAGILALIGIGYFFADVLLKITEMPYEQTAAMIDIDFKEFAHGIHTL
ncbi:MAG: hypothetical protein IJD78_08235 [Clostridia bacterium]|nr:hypothetical protein [Clostridia bacterium]MBQ3007533.1 hypothetical protein [Clostridia bacterium]